MSSLVAFVCCCCSHVLTACNTVAADPSSDEQNSPSVIVLSNLETNGRTVERTARVRVVGEETKSFPIYAKDRLTVSIRPTERLEYSSGDQTSGDNGWIAVDAQGIKEVEFQIQYRGNSPPIWNVRTISRRVLINSMRMKLMPIPAGTFQMGSRLSADRVAAYFTRRGFQEETSNFTNEHPRHEVVISKPFYISAHEVTNSQFALFVNSSGYETDADRDGQGATSANPNLGALNDSRVAGATWRTAEEGWSNHAEEHNLLGASGDVPVVNVSWRDANSFCEWLSDREGFRYRLPTEAEWEYACRAGSTTMYWTGDSSSLLHLRANVPDIAYGRCQRDADYEMLRTNDGYCRASPVGSFQANGFGLFDMHGNVWEWCQDTYGADFYSRSPKADPVCLDSTDLRLIRGGCFM